MFDEHITSLGYITESAVLDTCWIAIVFFLSWRIGCRTTTMDRLGRKAIINCANMTDRTVQRNNLNLDGIILFQL